MSKKQTRYGKLCLKCMLRSHSKRHSTISIIIDVLLLTTASFVLLTRRDRGFNRTGGLLAEPRCAPGNVRAPEAGEGTESRE